MDNCLLVSQSNSFLAIFFIRNLYVSEKFFNYQHPSSIIIYILFLSYS